MLPGLELRIWKGKAIFKKGTLDFGGHFGYAKRHQGHKKKGTKAPPKRQQIQRGGGGGGIPTHFFLTLKKISPKKQKKQKQTNSQTAQLRPRGSVCSFEGLLITFGFVWVSPGSGADPPKSECNKIKKPLEVEAYRQSHRAPRSKLSSAQSLRSTQCKTHCNANGMRCDLHQHEITSINDKK